MQSKGKPNDGIEVKGQVHILLKDAQGNVKVDRVEKNLVVTAGLVLIARALAVDSFTAPSHMAVGTDNTAASAGQTALVAESARQALTSTTRTSNSVEYVGTFGAGVGTGTIEEAGVLNNSSGGTMLARFLTGTFVKAAGDVLILTWTITIG
jgi:hypothetical protein